MQESEIFLTMAELGIGLAGFSGVVVAFGYRGTLSVVDKFRFLSAFSVAICVVVLGLIPVALGYLLDEREVIWRISSACAVAYFVIATPMFRNYALTIHDELSRLQVPDSRFIYWTGIVFALISAENLVGWPVSPNFGMHFLSVLLALIISAYTFAMIVIYRPPDDSND
jgi:hypothetical protein